MSDSKIKYKKFREELEDLIKKTKDKAIEQSSFNQAVLVKNIESLYNHFGSEISDIQIFNFYKTVESIWNFLDAEKENEEIKYNRFTIDDVVKFVPEPEDEPVENFRQIISEPKRDEDLIKVIDHLNSLPEKEKEFRPTKIEDFWECDRCNRTSDDNSYEYPHRCPCPRGGCEAKVVGVKKTSVVIEYFNKEKDKEDEIE
jgi:hypothetical protein